MNQDVWKKPQGDNAVDLHCFYSRDSLRSCLSDELSPFHQDPWFSTILVLCDDRAEGRIENKV